MLISSMPVEEVLNVGSTPTVSTKRSTSHCTQPVGVSKYSERRLNPDSNVDFYFAEVAQLVELLPSKQVVESSSLFFRSK